MEQAGEPSEYVSFPKQPTATPKRRLITMCDGTWQNSYRRANSGSSNIARIARAIMPQSKDGKIPQILYYNPGIGTSRSAWKNFWGGEGFIDQIEQTYCFISYNYLPGDELFFYGFSRGAYMVRSISNLILDFGILRKPGMSRFAELFKIYTSRETAARTKALAELRTELVNNHLLIEGEKITIKFIGCFDSVGVLGIPHILPFIPSSYSFLDLQLKNRVENAYHALALDETRLLFRPVMWFFDPSSPHIENYQQTWFTGAHINIGGGSMGKEIPGTGLLSVPAIVYLTKLCRRKLAAAMCRSRSRRLKAKKQQEAAYNTLSDGTLIWMISKSRPFLDFDEDYLHCNIRAQRISHEERGGPAGDGFHKPLDLFPELPGQLESPWYNGPIADNYYGMYMFWLVFGRHVRRVLGYTPKNGECGPAMSPRREGKKSRKGKKPACSPTSSADSCAEQAITNECIHRSVLDRGTTHPALEAVYWGEESEVVDDGMKKVEVEEYSDFELEFWRDEKQFP
ncbi:hypothetical protein BZA70DRAFT_290639 [Myxozyma melibiosi]|uniref:T6SS Phospholipase effector Tle1-like catalytic domain-containing protein n=1 Tax=Myxozyma melibiosi TaxID=54550 RepID=A0ABR1F2L7_9ASCO